MEYCNGFSGAPMWRVSPTAATGKGAEDAASLEGSSPAEGKSSVCVLAGSSGSLAGSSGALAGLSSEVRRPNCALYSSAGVKEMVERELREVRGDVAGKFDRERLAAEERVKDCGKWNGLFMPTGSCSRSSSLESDKRFGLSGDQTVPKIVDSSCQGMGVGVGVGVGAGSFGETGACGTKQNPLRFSSTRVLAGVDSSRDQAVFSGQEVPCLGLPPSTEDRTSYQPPWSRESRGRSSEWERQDSLHEPALIAPFLFGMGGPAGADVPYAPTDAPYVPTEARYAPTEVTPAPYAPVYASAPVIRTDNPFDREGHGTWKRSVVAGREGPSELASQATKRVAQDVRGLTQEVSVDRSAERSSWIESVLREKDNGAEAKNQLGLNKPELGLNKSELGMTKSVPTGLTRPALVESCVSVPPFSDSSESSSSASAEGLNRIADVHLSCSPSSTRDKSDTQEESIRGTAPSDLSFVDSGVKKLSFSAELKAASERRSLGQAKAWSSDLTVDTDKALLGHKLSGVSSASPLTPGREKRQAQVLAEEARQFKLRRERSRSVSFIDEVEVSPSAEALGLGSEGLKLGAEDLEVEVSCSSSSFDESDEEATLSTFLSKVSMSVPATPKPALEKPTKSESRSELLTLGSSVYTRLEPMSLTRPAGLSERPSLLKPVVRSGFNVRPVDARAESNQSLTADGFGRVSPPKVSLAPRVSQVPTEGKNSLETRTRFEASPSQAMRLPVVRSCISPIARKSHSSAELKSLSESTSSQARADQSRSPFAMKGAVSAKTGSLPHVTESLARVTGQHMSLGSSDSLRCQRGSVAGRSDSQISTASSVPQSSMGSRRLSEMSSSADIGVGAIAIAGAVAGAGAYRTCSPAPLKGKNSQVHYPVSTVPTDSAKLQTAQSHTLQHPPMNSSRSGDSTVDEFLARLKPFGKPMNHLASKSHANQASLSSLSNLPPSPTGGYVRSAKGWVADPVNKESSDEPEEVPRSPLNLRPAVNAASITGFQERKCLAKCESQVQHQSLARNVSRIPTVLETSSHHAPTVLSSTDDENNESAANRKILEKISDIGRRLDTIMHLHHRIKEECVSVR